MHDKILIATTPQPVASLLTPLEQLLTSCHLLSRPLYIQQTGTLLRYHCAGVVHRIPRQYNGDLLQWHEWYGQFKSAIYSQSLSDDAKLTYLKTLVTSKAKTAIAEFAYCGAMYKDALCTLEPKFGQPQAVLNAHLDKLNSFPPLKMHNSDNII